MKNIITSFLVFVLCAPLVKAQAAADNGLTELTTMQLPVQVLCLSRPPDVWMTTSQADWKTMRWWEFEISGEQDASVGYQISLEERTGTPAYLQVRNRTVEWKSLSTDSYQSMSWSSTGTGYCTGLKSLSSGGSGPGTLYFRIGCEAHASVGTSGGVSSAVIGVCTVMTYEI